MGAPEPGAERPGGSLHPRMWAVDRPGLGGRRQAVACAPGQMARRRPGLSPEGRPCCLMVGGNPHRNGVQAAHGARVLLTNLSPQPLVCPACLPQPPAPPGPCSAAQGWPVWTSRLHRDPLGSRARKPRPSRDRGGRGGSRAGVQRCGQCVRPEAGPSLASCGTRGGPASREGHWVRVDPGPAERCAP